MKYFVLALRLVTAVILFQTLYFKFTGAPESIYIFSQLGVEPLGRWFAGVSELIAGILLLIPATQALGALMALGVISGALLSHLFVLGIVVQGDGGLLFGLAVIVFICSALIVFLKREALFSLLRRFI
jgi:putative oxidoreductase